MLLTEDREIIDIYNSKVLKENNYRGFITAITPNNLIDKFGTQPKIFEKHIKGAKHEITSGSKFNNYVMYNTTLKQDVVKTQTLMDDLKKCKWKGPFNAGGTDKSNPDQYYQTDNFSGNAECLVKTLSDFGSNDMIDLDFKNLKLEATKQIQTGNNQIQTGNNQIQTGNNPKTQTVTMIFTQYNEPKTIHPGPRNIGRNNILADREEDMNGSNLRFIPFTRLVNN